MKLYEIQYTQPNLRCYFCYIQATSRQEAMQLFYQEYDKDNDYIIISLDEVYDYEENL